MTEKRFSKYVPDSYGYTFCVTIVDNETGKQSASIDDFVDLLNEQHEENEQLKSDYKTLQLQDNDRKQYQRELEKENEELKTQLDYAENLITTHLPVYYQKKWWNFKMGHKEYNDFWEEKLKKHKERLE